MDRAAKEKLKKIEIYIGCVIYSQHSINNNKGTRLKDKKQKKQKI
jgi:hypothetical protein